jgi:hypothetical protein
MIRGFFTGPWCQYRTFQVSGGIAVNAHRAIENAIPVPNAQPPATDATLHQAMSLGATMSMGVSESALIVLGAIEHLSVERDRDRMQLTMLRILADLAAVDRSRGAELLAEAGGSVKVALFMAKTGLPAAEARASLSHQQQSLRAALQAHGAS